MKYKFTNQKNENKKEYKNLILALAKKNYIHKLFNKENIKTNKINIKLLEFLGEKKIEKKEDKTNDNNNNTLKENYENGLEIEINNEEKEEYLRYSKINFLCPYR